MALELLDQLVQMDNVFAILDTLVFLAMNAVTCIMLILDLAQVTIHKKMYQSRCFILTFLVCDCNTMGSFTTSCDDSTGQCSCKEGYAGTKCDTCATDFYESATDVCTGKLGSQTFNFHNLKKSYLFLVCPDGWFTHDGACFKVSGVKKTFLDAVAACGAETAAPAKLFEPTSEAQNEAIFNIMKGIFGDETEYFVGIKLDPNDPDGGT